ncbi:MAG TPA: hypothetical protein VHJ34_14985 [Actinomycetota bacterium]|nr:hypothetical protein [Actinomycetota bacterium]
MVRRALVVVACVSVALLGFVPASSGQLLPAPPALAVSDNVDVLGNVPGSFFGMNFKGDYAYATGSAGLTVFDISRPANPVVAGTLALPHFENEDVDLCGDLLVIANDAINPAAPLFVIDISNPRLPTVAGTLSLSLEGTDNGAGHIANFVTSDCTQLWVDGGWEVEVVDLSDPIAPRSLGSFVSEAAKSPAFDVTHDSEVDSQGIVWSVGGGGAAGYRLTDDPLAPELVASTSAAGVNPSPYNDFILHNSQRRGKTLLVTEEDYVDIDEPQPGSCNGQGKFETWSLQHMKPGQITPLDTWETELNGTFTGGSSDSKAPVTVNCSSHWFDEQDGIVATAWYEQGVRFLDVTNPSDIRQVGYYLPANGSTWASYWVPNDPTGELVYTTDAYRGLDVLRIDDGGKQAKTRRAPIPRKWYGEEGTSSGVDGYRRSDLFGWSCPIPLDL